MPTVIVLQEHRFGCNWTTIRQGGEIHKIALGLGALPELLFVASNTDLREG